MIKTGKSTLMNSLVQQYIVPTAVEVLTYSVNWFHHVSFSPNKNECVVVHFLDGAEEVYKIEALDQFVKYTSDNKEYLDKIHWVDVFIDNPLLLEFDLIDTPGLSSLVGEESQHTRDLLVKDENRPDAIIYLMKKGIKKSDINAVREFHEATGLMSGINTVAVLSRVDELNNGFDDAQDIINDNILSHSEIKFYFSRVFPISALMAEASVNLTHDNINVLLSLADKDDIDDYLLNSSKFVDETPYFDKSQRIELIKYLSISGVRLVISALRYSDEVPANNLRAYLYAYSHVEQVKHFLIQHFGQRAEFLRAQKAILAVKQKCTECSRSTTIIGSDRKQLLEVMRRMDLFLSSFEEEFASYYILSDYYNMKDYFDDEIWERAKQVLGEYGESDKARFGPNSVSSREEIIKLEKQFWLNTSYSYSIMSNPKGAIVARKISELIK